LRGHGRLRQWRRAALPDGGAGRLRPAARDQCRGPEAPRLRRRPHRRHPPRLPRGLHVRRAAGGRARAPGRTGRRQRGRAPDAGFHRGRRQAAAAMTAGRPRFALVAGEASGDLLGAGLVESLRERFPGAVFAGVGGDAMRAAGVDTWHDAGELAVMGLSEVLAHLPRLLRLRRGLRRRLLAWAPDAFVGIDAPDFNLGLERQLKARGICTVHYVSPSVWAWRQGRAARIGRSADRVRCVLPMGPPMYAGHGGDARFVGHPMADAMPLNPDRRGARAALGVPQDAPVLAVLPGSRRGEIARLGPDFLDAATRVAARVPGLEVLVPAANAACREALAALLPPPGPAAPA